MKYIFFQILWIQDFYTQIENLPIVIWEYLN
jgi:hypothetical protein